MTVLPHLPQAKGCILRSFAFCLQNALATQLEHFAPQNADTNGLRQLCRKRQRKDLNVRKNKSCSHFYFVKMFT